MKKEGNYILKEYIGKTIGLDFKYKGSVDQLVKHLPQYLKGVFDFSRVEIDGQEFLLLIPSTMGELPTSQIVKFAMQVGKQTGRQTLLQFKSLDSAKRRTLINHRTNFVVPGKQIYIPSLRMNLNESGSIQDVVAKENLSPSAQLLLLYHLQKKSLEDMPFKDMAELLGYSKKTISLVVAELQQLSVCEVVQTNERNKVLQFHKRGRELWDSIAPLLTSPVQKVWHIEKGHLPGKNMPLYRSYDTALAHYTFMADSLQPSFAIDRRVFAGLQENLQPFLHPEEGDILLEVWKYDPSLLAEGQFIDKLSLSLIYKDIDDERIRKEITEMIDKIIW